MVDYKKKYLKYKKKYLAIKKLKGGTSWSALAKGAQKLRDDLVSNVKERWRVLPNQEFVPAVREAVGTGCKKATYVANNISIYDFYTKYAQNLSEDLYDEFLKHKDNFQKMLRNEEEELTIFPLRPDQMEEWMSDANGKKFKLFKTNDSIPFTQKAWRMGFCEGHRDLHSLASFAFWDARDLDRFIVVVRPTLANRWVLDPDEPHSGVAQRLTYPMDTEKQPHINIYSDHDALSIPISVPVQEGQYEPKLITFNLEGLCWGNEGEEEEWNKSIAHFLPKELIPLGFKPEHITSAGNNFRLENVISLLKQYIQPESGNIFLFQEVVLKNAAKAPREKKKSLEKLKEGLDIESMNYTLEHDGLTGAILYDNTQWQKIREINIERHYVDKSGVTHHESDKKSNAYILKHILSEMHIMVVNIHLMSTENPDLRKSELAYIYDRVKTESGDFKIPVYFGGDWNSEWTRETKINHCTLVEIDRIIENYDEKNNPEYMQILHHLISKKSPEDLIGLLG